VRVYFSMYMDMHVFMYVHTYIRIYECYSLLSYVYIHICTMYICTGMYVCRYVNYVCINGCMYVLLQRRPSIKKYCEL
jgi:hypothetical protein